VREPVTRGSRVGVGDISQLFFQNLKLFTRVTLELPFPKWYIMPPGNMEGHGTLPDVLEHRNRLAMGHSLQDLAID